MSAQKWSEKKGRNEKESPQARGGDNPYAHQKGKQRGSFDSARETRGPAGWSTVGSIRIKSKPERPSKGEDSSEKHKRRDSENKKGEKTHTTSRDEFLLGCVRGVKRPDMGMWEPIDPE